MLGTTNLLHEHDEESTLRSTTVAPDTEELALTGFDIEKLGGVVHVTGGLNFVGSESAGGLEGFCPSAFFHVPG
jgi:hypothetical protein